MEVGGLQWRVWRSALSSSGGGRRGRLLLTTLPSGFAFPDPRCDRVTVGPSAGACAQARWGRARELSPTPSRADGGDSRFYVRVGASGPTVARTPAAWAGATSRRRWHLQGTRPRPLKPRPAAAMGTAATLARSSRRRRRLRLSGLAALLKAGRLGLGAAASSSTGGAN
jgi:hypothetical protein